MTMGNDLQSAVAELGRIDSSRLTYGRDYSVDLQATRSQAERQGRRLGPLITNVNPQVFQRPTFRLFLTLLDNYKRVTGTAESIGPHELREQSDFLDACMATPVMQHAHRWLAGRQLIGGSPQQFKDALTQMWFSLYRRNVQNDSCGFEHVFLGESDDGQVKGLHSWIQFHLEERNGHLEYRGYLNPHGRGGGRADAVPEDRVISAHFGWLGETKAVSSIIMGSTPEFELALYTMCFLSGQEENHVFLDDYELKIKAYRIHSKYGDKIGTVYPELLSKGGGGGYGASGGGGYVQHAPQQYHQNQGYAPQQQPHRPPHQQQPQHYQQQPQNQADPNETTSQGCVNLIAAILGIFCAGDKNKGSGRN